MWKPYCEKESKKCIWKNVLRQIQYKYLAALLSVYVSGETRAQKENGEKQKHNKDYGFSIRTHNFLSVPSYPCCFLCEKKPYPPHRLKLIFFMSSTLTKNVRILDLYVYVCCCCCCC